MSLPPFLQKRAELLGQCPAPSFVSEADTTQLPVEVRRAGDCGPLILIVHGGVQGGAGGGPDTFAGQMALAERGYRVALFVRPGFGKSASRGVDDMERDADLITDLMEQDVHLIGHSWGGAEALLAAARRPAAVRSLTLVEPALFTLLGPPPADGGPLAQMLLSAQSPADYARRFAVMMTGPREQSGPANLDDEQQATRLGCSLLQARMANPEALQNAVDVVRDYAIPLLSISGGWKPLFDKTCERVAQLAGGEHVIVPSTNHFPQQVSADRFNDVVAGFLGRASAAGHDHG